MTASLTTCEEIFFASDDYLLKGILHLPAVKKPPVVFGSHGLLSTGSSPKQIELANACCKNGIAFFRFDHRGCGESQGVFIDVTNLDARQNDFLAAVNVIKKRTDLGNRTGLFGSSFGGTTCISLAGLYDIDAMVTFAAPISSHVLIDAAKRTHSLTDTDDLNNLPLSFYKNSLRFDVTGRLSDLKRILVVHGEDDAVVPVSHAKEIFYKAGEPKALTIQPNGDHRMSDVTHQQAFLKETVRWFKTFLID